MDGIPHYILLAATLTAATVSTVLRGIYSKKYADSQAGYHILNCGVSAVCALLIAAMSSFNLSCSGFTVFLGIVFGATTGIQAITYSTAIGTGPVSLTSVIVSLSTVITALSGLFWGEKLSVWQIAGIALMTACFFLSAKKEKNEKKAGAKWFATAFITFLLSGAIGIMQKIHQTSAYSEELYPFLVTAFVFSAILSLACLPFALKKNKGEVFMPQPPENRRFKLKITSIVVFTGICIAFNNVINLYLSGKMPAAVFFPTVNGGGLILGVIAALIFFKEKPAPKQWAGLAAGIAAVILLCI